jgi:3-oxoacyl-[acyl-carrier-protein] synthase-3
MEARVKSVRIAGMQAAVPVHKHSFVETPEFFTDEEAKKIYKSTGIHSRRILPDHLCASDMCLAAAEELLKSLNWNPDSVDVLIFVSQDADYALPATSCLIQYRLGLPKTAACLDISLGCSGFIYGTWVASQLLNCSNGGRALVLCGDTSSRHLLESDRGTRPLFGDAGVATALEVDHAANDTFFVIGTDGSGGKNISVPAGGKRKPIMSSRKMITEEKYNKLFEESRLHLNGPEVFAFTLREVPKMVNQILDFAELSATDIDMCVMHQANKFILEHLRKKIGLQSDKFLIDLESYGNTSSASVPLAMCNRLKSYFDGQSRTVLLSGFGVGWSWGAMVTRIKDTNINGITEINDDFEKLELT